MLHSPHNACTKTCRASDLLHDADEPSRAKEQGRQGEDGPLSTQQSHHQRRSLRLRHGPPRPRASTSALSIPSATASGYSTTTGHNAPALASTSWLSTTGLMHTTGWQSIAPDLSPREVGDPSPCSEVTAWQKAMSLHVAHPSTIGSAHRSRFCGKRVSRRR